VSLEVRGYRTWRKAGGAALRHAKDFLLGSEGPCLVIQGDRPIDRRSLMTLAETSLGTDRAALLISEPPREAHRFPLELVDVPKVRHSAGRATAVGQDLVEFQALSTGHAVVGHSILESVSHLNNPSLEEALAKEVENGAVRVVVGKLVWPGGPKPVEVGAEVEAILESKAHPRYTLLNPGPVNTTPRVKSALIHHDVCHRDDSFSELMVSLAGKLRRVFRAGPEHSICLLTGSGTAAMECALSSAVARDGKVLVISNGAFGERLLEIAKVHDLEVVHLAYSWGEPIVTRDVERAFASHPEITACAMVMHETSVGLLNQVREVCRLARRHGALSIVDAVSALGAEDLDVVRDDIDICFSSANKCLHAVSGVGFLCVAPDVWSRIAHIPPRSFYLDLKRYRDYADDLAQTPFTPAVSAYFALDAACAEFLADGHAARFLLYKRRNERLRRGLHELGMPSFTKTGHESHSVVTCGVPQDISASVLYDRLRDRGYIVYACKGILADRFLQVANMGDLPEGQIDAFLKTVGEVLGELNPSAANRNFALA